MSHSVTIWRNVNAASFFAPDNGTYLWSWILIYRTTKYYKFWKFGDGRFKHLDLGMTSANTCFYPRTAVILLYTTPCVSHVRCHVSCNSLIPFLWQKCRFLRDPSLIFTVFSLLVTVDCFCLQYTVYCILFPVNCVIFTLYSLFFPAYFLLLNIYCLLFE